MPSASRTSQNESGLINLIHHTNPLRFEEVSRSDGGAGILFLHVPGYPVGSRTT
jgi:hypothetical protein